MLVNEHCRLQIISSELSHSVESHHQTIEKTGQAVDVSEFAIYKLVVKNRKTGRVSNWYSLLCLCMVSRK